MNNNLDIDYLMNSANEIYYPKQNSDKVLTNLGQFRRFKNLINQLDEENKNRDALSLALASTFKLSQRKKYQSNNTT